MISFIRRLFEPQQVTLTLEELEQKLVELENEKEKETLSKAVSCIESIKETLSSLQKQAEELMNAPMPDEKHVDPKIKTIVKSQQSFFVGQVRIFVNHLTIPEITKDATKSFAELFNAELAAFTQKTVKSFAVTYHLFYKELDEIKQTLKTLDELRNNLNNVLNKDISELSETTKTLISKRIAAKSLLKEKEELKEKEAFLNRDIAKAKKSFDAIQKDDKLIHLEKELLAIEREEREISSEISTFFLQTKRQWLKLAKLHPEHAKAIDNLLKNQERAEYQKLYSLFISALQKKSLGNEEYSKLLKKANLWSPEHLSERLNQQMAVRLKKERLSKEILPIHNQKDSLAAELNVLEKELGILQRRIAETEKELNSTIIDKQKISQFASDLFGKKVIIVD